jgi:hypothetical protein
MSGIDAHAIAMLDDGRRRYRPLKPMLEARLRRGFPRGASKRILMIHAGDTIAWPQFYPFFHFADHFAEAGYAFRAVAYPAEGADTLIVEADAILLQSPYMPPEGELEAVLERLSSLNPTALITYCDWFAPTDVRLAERVADHVAYYAKKSLLRDRDYYRHEQPTHTLLCQYYAEQYDLVPDAPYWEVRPDIVDRLTLAPGFVTSPRLLSAFENGVSPDLDRDRPIDVHARFSASNATLAETGRDRAGEHTHWYVVMRTAARDAVSAIADRCRIAHKGKVPTAAYMEELTASKLCFSPFGFGELCWRDVEAMSVGSVLIKPSMEHLECFCGAFRPGETYVQVRWDFADLEEKVAWLLAHPYACRAIAARAFEAVRDYLAGPKLELLLNKLTYTRPRRAPDFARPSIPAFVRTALTA